MVILLSNPFSTFVYGLPFGNAGGKRLLSSREVKRSWMIVWRFGEWVYRLPVSQLILWTHNFAGKLQNCHTQITKIGTFLEYFQKCHPHISKIPHLGNYVPRKLGASAPLQRETPRSSPHKLVSGTSVPKARPRDLLYKPPDRRYHHKE